MNTDYLQQANDFLKETNSTLDIKFLKFDSMGWDSDGDERNIFKCVLRNKVGEYVFNFGNCLNYSLESINLINSNEKKDLYIGIKTDSFTFATKLNICFSDLRKVDGGKMLINELYNQKRLILEIDNFINKEVAKFKGYKYEKDIFKSSIKRTLNIGSIEQTIKNRINREIEEAKTIKTLSGENLIKIKPSNYNVLACLQTYINDTFEGFCDDFGYDNDSIKALRTFEACTNEVNSLNVMYNSEELEKLSEIQ